MEGALVRVRDRNKDCTKSYLAQMSVRGSIMMVGFRVLSTYM